PRALGHLAFTKASHGSQLVGNFVRDNICVIDKNLDAAVGRSRSNDMGNVYCRATHGAAIHLPALRHTESERAFARVMPGDEYHDGQDFVLRGGLQRCGRGRHMSDGASDPKKHEQRNCGRAEKTKTESSHGIALLFAWGPKPVLLGYCKSNGRSLEQAAAVS